MNVEDLILYEDNHIIAVNKPAGTLVQGDITGDLPLGEYIKGFLKKKYNKPGAVFLGVPHRLDRPVSGVVLFARTSKALSRLTEMFRNQEIQKTYWAIIDKKPQQTEGRLEHFLIKDQNRNIVKAYPKAVPEGKKSILEYKVIKNVGNQYLLEINPHTGRPHQIRVQLSTMGCPIVGDLKYGAAGANEDASICLHARRIDFIHPVKKEKIKIEAPLPAIKVWKPFR